MPEAPYRIHSYCSARAFCAAFFVIRYATAVEFALVSVPFLGLLFAIFETALVFFTAQGVEATPRRRARS